MAQRPFATGGTERKLKTIEDYLKFYTQALSGKFRLTYIDAFAGSGDIPAKAKLPLLESAQDLAEFTEGSASRALNIRPEFDRYLLIDSKRGNVTSLAELRERHPDKANKIEVVHGDANEAITSFCQSLNFSMDRAVLFLDPFGNQVSWQTIEVIASTPGIDLWYLFPAGLGVLRQISQDGSLHPDAEPSMDMMFGTTEWREHLVRRHVTSDMFGEKLEHSERVETAAAVTDYMIERLKIPFEGKVLDSWLPLGKGKGHWYSLLLAWSNPSPKAVSLVRRVGNDIMLKPR